MLRRRDNLVAFIVDSGSCSDVTTLVDVMMKQGEFQVVAEEREGEERDEVRREERVYPRTGGQGDGREDRRERHGCT